MRFSVFVLMFMNGTHKISDKTSGRFLRLLAFCSLFGNVYAIRNRYVIIFALNEFYIRNWYFCKKNMAHDDRSLIDFA